MGTEHAGGHDIAFYVVASAQWVTYTYDAYNRRVQKSGGSNYVYAPDGTLVAEYDSTGANPTEYIYLGAARIAKRDSSGSVYYYFSDDLGSGRVMTDSTGHIKWESDYEPFGAERVITNTVANKYKFGGKERDTETGNDYFTNRCYEYSFSRFMTPDPAGKGAARLDDPQTWNLYAYVRNNPTSLTDPTGLTPLGLANMAGNQLGESEYSWIGDNPDPSSSVPEDRPGDEKAQNNRIVVIFDSKTSRGTLYLVSGSGKDQRIVLQGGVVVGGNGHVTPTGNFHAGSWEVDHRSKLYGALANKAWSKSFLGLNAFGPYQLHIKELTSRGIYIHGTMGPGWCPTTAISGLAVSQTSHGCVRMCNRDDVALHNLLPHPEGTPIKISTNPSDAPER